MSPKQDFRTAISRDRKVRAVRTRCFLGTISAALALGTYAQGIAESKLPPPAPTPIDFDRDIKPIFENHCYQCHGPERPKSGFRLDDRAAALKGGDQGVSIIPGESARSPLIHYVAHLVEDMKMPPPGKGERLTPEQVGLLRAWIDQGAPWSSSAASTKIKFSVTPSFAWITVSGDRQMFREHWGMREGWSGGVQSFQLEEQSPTGVKLYSEGRALLNQDDYQLKLTLEKPNVAFARLGFEQYRRYYDDTGGYYEGFDPSSFSLDRGLDLDIGRAWLDLGLTLPDWPKVTLGYEHQYRDGTKSSLAWSDAAVFDGVTDPLIRPIVPGYKDIDEAAHILKLDVNHELYGVLIEDSFRAEFYDLGTRRVELDPIVLGEPKPDSAVRYDEDYDHFQAVNTFRLEKRLQDWLLLGGGYLYSKLDGDASFSREAFTPSTSLPLREPDDVSNPIVLKRESHVFNLSSLWGPWEGLSLTAGLQNEWTSEDGFGQGLLRPSFIDETLVQRESTSQRDKSLLEESLGLRYTKIPFTVLFADSRFRQEWTDHYERDENSTTGSDFLRDTDTSTDLKEVRTGFTVSPWTRVSWNSSYRYRLHRSDYDHDLDTSPNPLDPSLGIDPSNGYPAFIRRRDIELNEVESRLILHPARWVKTTLKYQLVAADYRTETDSSVDLFTGAVQPGGDILAGNYDAHIYSVNAIFSPWRRLNLSTTFAYSDARTVSGVNGRAGVTPYGGDTFTVLSSANFILSKTTDWRATYSYSRSDFRQEGQDESLPLGIRYDRHGLLVGVTRRFKKNISTNLQYGFFHYDEPSFGNVNNYTAHAVFASLGMVFD